MGGEPAHRTNPQPGGPGFFVRVISLSLWCPHTTLARQQDPLDRGPYRVLSAGASRTLVFFSRLLLLPLLLSQPGLGPDMAELVAHFSAILNEITINGQTWIASFMTFIDNLLLNTIPKKYRKNL
jgi:hypothetical protein